MTGRDIPTPQAIRKLAVLLGTLDEQAAAALLAQLDRDTAEQARECLATLHGVSPREQEEVIAEFLARRPPSREEASAVEVDDSLARRLAGSLDESTPAPRSSTASPRFKPWSNLPPAKLGRTLRHEHPQVVAVVLAQLPPAKAAEVLSEFPDDEQAAILQRVARIESPDPTLVGEIAAALDARLPQLGLGVEAPPQPAPTVQAILAAAPDESRRRWLAELTSHGAANESLEETAADEAVVDAAAPVVITLNATAASSGVAASSAPPGVSPAKANASVSPRAKGRAVEVLRLHVFDGRDERNERNVSESASSPEKKTTDSDEPSMIAGRIHVVDEASRRASDGVSVKAGSGSTASDSAGNANERLNEWPHELVEVARLDDAQLAAVLRAAEPLVVVLALAGAPPEVVAEFRARWSTREARLLERQIQRLGTWRADDARRAQEQLVAVAREVVRRSRPVPPSNGPRRVA